MKNSKSHHRQATPPNPRPKKNGKLISEAAPDPHGAAQDPVETIFEETGAAIDAEAAAASGALPDAAAGQSLETFDSRAFLLTGVTQLVAQVVLVAKLAGGWSSPAIPGPNGTFLLSEEDWQAAVSQTSVAVIEKRWPDLANKVTPEFALLALVAPWTISNLAPMLLTKIIPLVKGLFRGRHPASNGDPGSNGNRENVSTAETSRQVPESVFAGSDGR